MYQFFATTTRGLNRDLQSMRLYEKAKSLGIWNPTDIDISYCICCGVIPLSGANRAEFNFS